MTNGFGNEIGVERVAYLRLMASHLVEIRWGVPIVRLTTLCHTGLVLERA